MTKSYQTKLGDGETEKEKRWVDYLGLIAYRAG